ncbi:hypothetical protein N7452_005139 [Penicillium brevicompactum]|uniref:Uncharacterized protein n=1 Tax=Penicillium brevicompactum TaxID=5074 RepID=A0A9W9QI82_PENBR|nr:hypothetical protein N7452_005139 [Penicillium brevicompactum]
MHSREQPRPQAAHRDTPEAFQSNIEFLPMWKDTYILTGGYNVNGWLLKKSSPSDKGTCSPKDGCTRGLTGLDHTLTVIEPVRPTNNKFRPTKGRRASIWEWEHQVFDISLRGTKPDDNRVIILEDGGGWLPMKDISGFTTEMDKINRRQHPDCIAQIGPWFATHQRRGANIGYVEIDSDEEDIQPPIKQQEDARSTESESEEDTKLLDDIADESTRDSNAGGESGAFYGPLTPVPVAEGKGKAATTTETGHSSRVNIMIYNISI